MNADLRAQTIALEIEQAIRHLLLIAVDARLYNDRHPKFQATLAEAQEFLAGLLQRAGEIEIKVVGESLVHGNNVVQKQLHTTDEFRRALQSRDIECLVFKPGVTRQELVEYAHFMRLSDAHRRQIGDPEKHLLDRGVHHIGICKLADMRHYGHAQAEARGLPIALSSVRCFHQENLVAIRHLQRKAEVAQVLDLDAAKDIVDSFLRESAANSPLLVGLSSLTESDEYTATHSLNVCLLSICLARYLGIDGSMLAQLGIACLLHDIGKMFIPLEILNKEGRLSPEEWNVVRDHPVLGARFLLTIKDLPALAPVVAYEHHMNLDESGYPARPADYRISMASQMAAISDLYDALTTNRPYRKAMPPAKAIEIMRKMDSNRFDPRIRDVFLEMLGPHPVGSVVRLSTGETGVVSRPNPALPDHPWVMVVRTAEGESLEPGVEVPLEDLPGRGDPMRSIVEPLDPTDAGIDPFAVLDQVAPSLIDAARARPMTG